MGHLTPAFLQDVVEKLVASTPVGNHQPV